MVLTGEHAFTRYQFQSFAQYRGKLAVKSPQELATLRAADDVWSVLGVLNYLQALVDKSGIVAELSSPGEYPKSYPLHQNQGVEACCPLDVLQ